MPLSNAKFAAVLKAAHTPRKPRKEVEPYYHFKHPDGNQQCRYCKRFPSIHELMAIPGSKFNDNRYIGPICTDCWDKKPQLADVPTPKTPI